jgi:diaminopimelate epimerase
LPGELQVEVTGVRIIKGHATENDFVIIDDRDGELELTAAFVRALCDRHAGIGGDGVLRVVRSANDRAAAPMAAETDFFMDYRNADGSVAEMCGNGVRLFLRYLQWAGLAGERAAVATRGGVRHVWSELDGSITVAMGQAMVLDDRPNVRVRGGSEAWAGIAVRVPNPHVVVALPAGAELATLDLSVAPEVDPALPDGQNVEFVQALGPRHLAMRVHERGVGETRSCGTGICAAVVSSCGPSGPDGTPWRVDVPGGSCLVRWNADGELWLTGPAELVGVVELDAHWLAAARSNDPLVATATS